MSTQYLVIHEDFSLNQQDHLTKQDIKRARSGYIDMVKFEDDHYWYLAFDSDGEFKWVEVEGLGGQKCLGHI